MTAGAREGREPIVPAPVLPPTGPYRHSVAVEGPLVLVSGQFGVRRDGTCPDGIGEQVRLAYGNVAAVLDGHDMTLGDVVKFTVLLDRSVDRSGFQAARRDLYEASFEEGRFPASTLILVDEISYPDALIEVEAVAARSGRTSRPPTAEG